MTKIQSGRQEVVAAGEPVRLVDEPMRVATVDIEAISSNTDDIYISGSSVGFAVSGSEQGFRLGAKDRLMFEDVDLHEIYVDAVVSAEGVIWGATVELQE